jgi:hypothetical protein
MKPKQMERWAKMRERGKRRFIWFYGVLAWGVTTGLLFCGAMQFLSPSPLPHPLVALAVPLIIFPLMGYFWGLLVWHYSERAYLARCRKAP